MRIELKHSDVAFHEEGHTYTAPDGHPLSGITSLIDRCLYPATYKGVPEAVLRRAAEYGTSVHKACERFDALWEDDGSEEVASYKAICKEHGLTHEASEYLVSDGERYASSIDKVFRASEDAFDLADIKTYGEMTAEKLQKARWQLSLYALLFEMQNPGAEARRLYVLHLRHKEREGAAPDHIAELIEVERVPAHICRELLEADAAGEPFRDPYGAPDDIAAVEDEYLALLERKKRVDDRLSALKGAVQERMDKAGAASWKGPRMTFTLKAASTRSTFSQAAFKKANPDIDLSPYMKESKVAPSLAVTLSKELKEKNA